MDLCLNQSAAWIMQQILPEAHLLPTRASQFLSCYMTAATVEDVNAALRLLDKEILFCDTFYINRSLSPV